MTSLPRSAPISFPANCILEQGKTYLITSEIKLTSQLIVPKGVTLIFQGGRFTADSPLEITAPDIYGIKNESEDSALITSKDSAPYLSEGPTIVAPDCPIFGENISVTGYWLLDRVPVVWFEPKLRNIITDANHRYDYADSFNKAIAMKVHGIVFLNRGVYRISKPIEIPVGITLLGEASDSHGVASTIMPTYDKSAAKSSNEASEETYSHTRMVFVNIAQTIAEFKNANKEKIFDYISTNPIKKTPATWVACENIFFLNDVSVFPFGRCVLSGNTGIFRNVKWGNFVQAVAFLREYGDAKMIENCTTYNDEFTDTGLKAFCNFYLKDDLDKVTKNEANYQIIQYIVNKACPKDEDDDPSTPESREEDDDKPEEKEDYNSPSISDLPDDEEGLKAKAFIESLQWEYFSMFNFGGAGDAIQFSHNHVNSKCKKLLLFSSALGASVFSNILNGDVKISRCKAFSFFSNHLESGEDTTGSQLYVDNSMVDIFSNYFEKGSRPSLYLVGSGRDCSIVNSSNNALSFMNALKQFLGMVQKPDGTWREEYVPESLEERAQRYSELSEYDIYMNEKVCLNLTDTYRMDLMNGSTVDMPYGILIDTPNGPLNDFNDFSYFASQNSAILQNYCVHASRSVADINAPAFRSVRENPDDDKKAVWLAPTGDYSYSYQIIWDRSRNIMKKENNSTSFNIPIEGNPQANTVHLEQGKARGTAVLRLSKAVNGNQFMVRLIRSTSSGTGTKPFELLHYVDIPFSGADRIYDNGISVAGFKWKLYLLQIAPASTPPVYKTMSYTDGLVKACAMSAPEDTSNWKTGDIIYNVGQSTGWTQIIIK